MSWSTVRIILSSVSHSLINVSYQKWNFTPIPFYSLFRYIYLRTDGIQNLWPHPSMLAHHRSLAKSMPYPHCLSWEGCDKCEHATNFKRMNNQCIKVLPFKMANIKPPIIVLKKKIYLLAGFPRNTSQRFETDNEVFVLVC